MKFTALFSFGVTFLLGSNLLAAGIEGSWRSACLTDSADPKAEVSMQYVNTFDASGKFSTSESVFSDRTCSTLMTDATMEGTYTTKDMGKYINLDRVGTKFLVAFADSQLVQALNMIEFCEYKDWQAGVHKDVTGKVCFVPGYDASGDVILQPVPFPEAGAEDYNIASINGDTLFFGIIDEDHDAMAQDSRPVEFDTEGFTLVK